MVRFCIFFNLFPAVLLFLLVCLLSGLASSQEDITLYPGADEMFVLRGDGALCVFVVVYFGAGISLG